jgi:hypothetical protein
MAWDTLSEDGGEAGGNAALTAGGGEIEGEGVVEGVGVGEGVVEGRKNSNKN